MWYVFLMHPPSPLPLPLTHSHTPLTPLPPPPSSSSSSDVLFSWLLGETDLDMTSDRQDADLQEFTPVPHIEALRYVIVVFLVVVLIHYYSPTIIHPVPHIEALRYSHRSYPLSFIVTLSLFFSLSYFLCVSFFFFLSTLVNR